MSGQMKSPALLTAEMVVAGKKTSLSLLRLMVGQHHFFLLCLLILLLIGDFLCYQQALPLEVDAQAGKVTLKVGSQSLALGEIGTPVLIELPAQNPVIHEYQMDGTDNTNNFTLDPDYFARIASTPYYRFQAWMRNLDGTSRWSDLHVYADSKQLESIDWPKNGSQVNWPAQNAASNLRLQIALRRPEIPMTLRIVTSKQQTIKITLDRNNRTI